MLGGRGNREVIYLSLHCRHQNDSCIKTGSYINVSLNVRDKVTRECPKTTTLFEEKGEPKWNRAEAFQLTSLTPYRGPNCLTLERMIKTVIAITAKGGKQKTRTGRLGRMETTRF